MHFNFDLLKTFIQQDPSPEKSWLNQMCTLSVFKTCYLGHALMCRDGKEAITLVQELAPYYRGKSPLYR